jgi:hypothetical protein
MLIGLTGCKGVGKDTAASFLIEEYHYVKLGFADILKQAVANLLDIPLNRVDTFKETGNIILSISEEYHPSLQKAISGRGFLQRFGTEMGRQTFGDDFWINLWDRQYQEIQGKSPSYIPIIVPDVRFNNEALFLNRVGGTIIEITRSGHETDGHESEEGIYRDLIAITVDNNASMESFRRRFLAVYHGLTVGVVGAS